MGKKNHVCNSLAVLPVAYIVQDTLRTLLRAVFLHWRTQRLSGISSCSGSIYSDIYRRRHYLERHM